MEIFDRSQPVIKVLKIPNRTRSVGWESVNIGVPSGSLACAK